ncbi:amidohydrolase family protein [Candidatus Micrarchaeota archaeon]|nr:amidohydrolase family protein [Candidatus Micrarchaeota archaeon]
MRLWVILIDVLIKNTTAFVNGQFVDCDIAISENKIQKIDRKKQLSKDRFEFVLDCSDSKKIAIPGLVNAHTHVAMSLLRGYGEGLSLHDWLKKSIWPVEAKLNSAEVCAGAKLGIC